MGGIRRRRGESGLKWAAPIAGGVGALIPHVTHAAAVAGSGCSLLLRPPACSRTGLWPIFSICSKGSLWWPVAGHGLLAHVGGPPGSHPGTASAGLDAPSLIAVVKVHREHLSWLLLASKRCVDNLKEHKNSQRSINIPIKIVYFFPENTNDWTHPKHTFKHPVSYITHEYSILTPLLKSHWPVHCILKIIFYCVSLYLRSTERVGIASKAISHCFDNIGWLTPYYIYFKTLYIIIIDIKYL